MTPAIISAMYQIETFPLQIAIELQSPDLAIAIQFFIDVISKHKMSCENLIEGSTWHFCAIESLQKNFPFWSEKMIRTRMHNLIKIGILKKGNFNKNKHDRTLWYSFVDESRWGLNAVVHAMRMRGAV